MCVCVCVCVFVWTRGKFPFLHPTHMHIAIDKGQTSSCRPEVSPTRRRTYKNTAWLIACLLLITFSSKVIMMHGLGSGMQHTAMDVYK